MPISNGSLLDLDCSDLTGWIDGDTGEAVSDQQTFDGKSCFAFDTNTSADTNDYAKRSKDVGSIEGLGNRIVASINLYCDAIGTRVNSDDMMLAIYRTDFGFAVMFSSDGLHIYDGTTWNEAGTDLVVQDTWQEWTFDIDISGGVASATCDIYLNNILQASSVDCSADNIGGTDGEVRLKLAGYATDDRISYVDWLKIGNGFGWAGKISGVTNPAKINGISVANIAKVNGI